ncbi:MAG: IS110 family transposase [Saprospiraceae bacterium]
MSSKDRKKKDYVELEVVHSGACGIDIGGKFHLVSIGQDQEKQVRKYGVHTEALHELGNWLVGQGINTVAMESTGVYWKSLWRILQDYGMEVVLVSRSWKQEKKTDVLDCMWLQQLHSMGLLKGSYLADNATEELKHLWRHRQGLVRTGNDYVRRMQKSMRLMNMCLETVLSSIVGASGQAIIQAIIEGQRDAALLAGLVDKRVQKPKEEIIKALQADWRIEHLFELQQCYELYQILEQKRVVCDEKIEELLNARIRRDDQQTQYLEQSGNIKKKRKNKNDPKFDVQRLSYALFKGIDLSAVDGISHGAIMSLLAEVGTDVKAFANANSFVSWLRLCPNNRISGGKQLLSRSQRTANALAQALKQSANAIGRHNKGALAGFFHRIAHKKGWKAAITATARKLAVIIWNMIAKQQPFNYMSNEQYQQQLKTRSVKAINRQITRWGIKPQDLLFDELPAPA